MVWQSKLYQYAIQSTPILLIFLAIGYAFAKSIFISSTDNPSRHFDGRYLYAASQCLGASKSPYNVAHFQECWVDSIEADYRASFVFPPTTLIYAYPMSLMDRDTAALYQDVVQAGACILLAILLWRFARLSAFQGWRKICGAFWLALGITSTGTIATMYLGQLGLLTALGVPAIILGVRNGNSSSLGAGTLLASFKPHLSLLAVAFYWAATPMALLKSKLIVFGMFIAFLIMVFLLSPKFITDFLASLTVHRNSRFAGIADVGRLFGLPDMIETLTSQRENVFIPASGCFLVFLLAACWFISGFRPADKAARAAALSGAVVIFGAFLFPHKAYDFVIYTIVFASCAALSLRTQIFLLAPMLFLWRPAFAGAVPWIGDQPKLLVDTSLLFVFFALAATAAEKHFLRISRFFRTKTGIWRSQ